MPNAVIRTTALAFLLNLAIASSAAYAQSGSAGGSIGNDEKSLSGSRSERSAEPAPSVRRSKPAAEERSSSRRRRRKLRRCLDGHQRRLRRLDHRCGGRHVRARHRRRCERNRQPERLGLHTRTRPGRNLHRRGPPFQPQRVRDVASLRRLRRNLDFSQAVRPKKPDITAERSRHRPDSSHILSGFAAHCHPTL